MTTPSVFVDARSIAGRRLTGWERYARGLAAILAAAPEVSLRATDPGSIVRRVGADLVSVPPRRKGFSLAHFPTYPPVTTTVAPTLMTLHDLTWWSHPETASRAGLHYYRRLAERAVSRTSLVTVSHAVAEEIRMRFGVGTVHVVNPVVVPREVPPTVRDRPYVLAVGSVEPRKNLAALVQAYEASGLRGSCDLVVAGRRAWGDLPGGAHLVEAPGDVALWGLLRGARALVLPTLYEGFGMPVVEAQAAGTPVLCSDLPVLREVSGGHAAFFDPTDVSSIAAGLATVGTDGVDVDAARENSRRYGPANTARQLEDLYRAHGVEVDLTPHVASTA